RGKFFHFLSSKCELSLSQASIPRKVSRLSCLTNLVPCDRHCRQRVSDISMILAPIFGPRLVPYTWLRVSDSSCGYTQRIHDGGSDDEAFSDGSCPRGARRVLGQLDHRPLYRRWWLERWWRQRWRWRGRWRRPKRRRQLWRRGSAARGGCDRREHF